MVSGGRCGSETRGQKCQPEQAHQQGKDCDDGQFLLQSMRAETEQFAQRTGAFKGRYHVLNGALSPMAGIGPGELRMRELSSKPMKPK